MSVANEEMLTLAEAAKLLPRGRSGGPIHVATLHRWSAGHNKFGARLETVRIGGVRYTSREALERFIAKLNGSEIVVSFTKCAGEKKKRAKNELVKAGW